MLLRNSIKIEKASCNKISTVINDLLMVWSRTKKKRKKKEKKKKEKKGNYESYERWYLSQRL